MILTNGAQPIAWSVQTNEEGSGYRAFSGTVVAHAPYVNPHDEYVVWTCASDDGIEYWCGGGAYFSDLSEAMAFYSDKISGRWPHRKVA